MIAVLFARADSVYKSIPGCDVWGAERDALNWPADRPGIFHPPCRAWGNYSTWAKPREGEKELALWALEKVRACGGVLEHPYSSKLWKTGPFCRPGVIDGWGGALFPVYQSWWGHRAPKKTMLYVVGAVPDLPDWMPAVTIKEIEHQGVNERERTPPDMARWLVALASRCNESAPGGTRHHLEKKHGTFHNSAIGQGQAIAPARW